MAEKIIANFSLKGTEKINAVLKVDSPYREHNMLYGRDEENGHPISAITGLETALNEKQEVINDLDEIRDGASLGATSVQPTRKINNKPLSSDITLTNTDVGALSIDTKYGSSLSLTINEQTYILTAQLKDQNGDNLGTAQTIDLPLETVVVCAEYDEDTKEVVLTLKNGETVRFSIADLVSGLQPTIPDLSAIRQGASKGETAVQPATLNDYALKSKIQELNATDSITLTDGYIYNGGEQTALTIALPTSVNVSFLVEIDFTSGSAPTTLTYPNTIKWSGDDVSNNVFTPVANKRYTMICYYNGVDFVFVTTGVVA